MTSCSIRAVSNSCPVPSSRVSRPGLPVLGGPALDGVVDNGRTGWVVPDQDPTQFVRETRARVGALLADDSTRRQMGMAARSDALARYAWPRIVEAHVAVYRTVAG